MRSANVKIAESNAPTTNPICTDIVSHALPPSSNDHNAAKSFVTAEAENQTTIANNSAKESNKSIRHLFSIFDFVIVSSSLFAEIIFDLDIV